MTTPLDTTAATTADDARASTLRHYLNALRRRRWVVAVCLLVPVLAAIAYGATRNAEYQGAAQVLLNRQNLANALTGTPDPSSQTDNFEQIVQTQAVIARSPAIAQAVVGAVPIAGLTYKEFLALSSVVPLPNADIIVFRVADGSRQLAVRLTNVYARQFVALRLQLDTAPLSAASTQLEQQIKQLQARPGGQAQLISQLISRQQQLRTLIALQTANAAVTSTAVSAQQIAPNPGKYIAIALLIGIVLAVALVAAYENLDTRVRLPNEVEHALARPFLAHIGPPTPALGGKLLMLASPRAPEAEAFRALRTSLHFLTLDRNIKTIMVSSALELEGKSTTVSNLAVTMARSGANVVLVDLDLRRPSLPQKFGLPPGLGMTDVALGRTSLDDALETIDIGDGAQGADNGHTLNGSLRLLPTGRTPPDPGEFVHSPSVLAILQQLRQTADVVLIDTPPILATGDAVALGSAVDAMFVVAKLPELRRPALAGLVRSLRSCPCMVLGFVATGASDVSDRYGYGYGYGYGSGYGDKADGLASSNGHDAGTAVPLPTA